MRELQHRVIVFAVRTLVAASVALLLGSCASTAPRPTSVQPVTQPYQLSRNDTVSVKVNSAPSVAVDEAARQRVAQQVRQKIENLRTKAAASTVVREYEVDVRLTRYDEGNAFARWMLAGLGQMHVDAHITVFLLPDRTRIAEFDVEKTFAWGGIYGLSMSIEDVEEGFAGGVAEGFVTPQ
jgi:hypothetical protein